MTYLLHFKTHSFLASPKGTHKFGKELNFDKAKTCAKSGAYFVYVAETVKALPVTVSVCTAEHF